MQPDKQQTVLQLCKLLLDDTRLKILGYLASQPASVSEMATALNLTEVTVSRQLARLKAVRLVATGAGDARGVYRLDLESLHAAKEDLFALDPVQATPAEPRNQADKVLDTFLDGERLRDIPAKHSKRLVILQWLVSKFETGVAYPERMVNELLKRHHPDYAYLRRLLVDCGLMQRERGVYQRTADGA